jgi:hypothetical protein
LVPRGCSPHSHHPEVKFYKEIWHSENITTMTKDENINMSHSMNNHQTCKTKNVTWYLEDVPHTAIFQKWNSIRKYGILKTLLPQHKMRISIFLILQIIIWLVKQRMSLGTSHIPELKFYKEIWHSEYIVPMTQDANINTCHSTNNHQTCKTKNVTWYLEDDPCTAIVQNWNSIRKCDILKTLFL